MAAAEEPARSAHSERQRINHAAVTLKSSKRIAAAMLAAAHKKKVRIVVTSGQPRASF
jgi:translation initiation factor 2B subunit (eIF-2B alpha/beta/delta family)